jgi:hypothetical protein
MPELPNRGDEALAFQPPKSDEASPYEPPKISKLGTVEELTMVTTESGLDTLAMGTMNSDRGVKRDIDGVAGSIVLQRLAALALG